MAAIAAWITAVRPRLVVVDVSVEVAVLARTLGVPVVVAAMRGDRSDPAHVLAYDLADALFAPWPGTLPEPQWPARWIAKTIHTGAFSRFDEIDVASSQVQPQTAVCLLGNGGSDLPERFAETVAAATPQWQWTFCGGDFGPSPIPLSDLLAAAQVVITHAGQNAVAEVAALRRPAVVVAQPRPHDEQLATVRALGKGDLAVTCDRWPAAGDWPELLAQAVDLGGAGWERWNDHHGAQRAAAALAQVASR
ncbi:MAG: glycosyltransferase [Allobranchiibius sp.]